MIQTYSHYFLSSVTTFEEITELLINVHNHHHSQTDCWPQKRHITMVIHNFFFHKITCYNFKILVKSCEIIHGNEIGQMWDFIS